VIVETSVVGNASDDDTDDADASMSSLSRESSPINIVKEDDKQRRMSPKPQTSSSRTNYYRSQATHPRGYSITVIAISSNAFFLQQTMAHHYLHLLLSLLRVDIRMPLLSQLLLRDLQILRKVHQHHILLHSCILSPLTTHQSHFIVMLRL
jgi:hypothetical protein